VPPVPPARRIPIDLRLAPMRDGEETQLAELLADAFADDPFGVGLGPEDGHRRRDLIAEVSRRDLARSRQAGHSPLVARRPGPGPGPEPGNADHDPATEEQLVGIAVAFPRGSSPVLPVGLTIASFVYLRAGVRVWLRANRAARDLARSHPGHPHLYLDQLAVAADHRRLGVGGLLLSAVIRRAEDQRLPTFLETMTERNVAFYEGFGFQVVGRIRLPRPQDGEGWLMERARGYPQPREPADGSN
jgi:ribosomal protein S18 acetylase RimI-like enzyme